MVLPSGETPDVTAAPPSPRKSPASAAARRRSHTRRAPSAVRGVLARVLVLNLIVVAIKVMVGVQNRRAVGPRAALESSLDLFNNIVGMVLVTVAARGPDELHPYGHAKFETLGALAIVTFLSISCFELLREGDRTAAGDRTRPSPPALLEVGLIGFTLVVNALVVVYERRRGRELSSSFLIADAAHTHSDVYVTLLAIASLGLTRVGLGASRPGARRACRADHRLERLPDPQETVPILVDERGLDSADVRRLVEHIPRIEEVRSVRSRAGASGVVFAEVTVGVAGSTSVADAHDIADEVENRIAEALGASEVVVHVEPS